MASALQNHSPIVVPGGRAPAFRWGQGSLQEIDHVPFVRPVVKLAATAGATAEIPSHPLLASWGQDARELQLVLAGAGRDPAEPVQPFEDHRHPAGPVARGLLGRLQADVRADRRPPGAPLPEHAAAIALDPANSAEVVPGDE